MSSDGNSQLHLFVRQVDAEGALRGKENGAPLDAFGDMGMAPLSPKHRFEIDVRMFQSFGESVSTAHRLGSDPILFEITGSSHSDISLLSDIA